MVVHMLCMTCKKYDTTPICYGIDDLLEFIYDHYGHEIMLVYPNVEGYRIFVFTNLQEKKEEYVEEVKE